MPKSGKCDLFDHIYEIGCKPEESELDCFNRFKEATKGILYQNFDLSEVESTPSKYIIDKLIATGQLSHISHHPDKKGYYVYYGKDYTYKSLIKNVPLTVTREIHFETMLDLIPYYSYIISHMASFVKDDSGKRSEIIYISRVPYIEQRCMSHCVYSGEKSDMWTKSYREECQSEFIRIYNTYYKDKL